MFLFLLKKISSTEIFFYFVYLNFQFDKILLILNKRLIGKNISAVSSKRNTTEDRIEGIYTNVNDKIQLVYYDTPGAIKHSDSYKSRKIVTRAWNVIVDCDKVKFKI